MEATSHLNNIQIMGGIGSAALTHQETMIVPDEKRVIAPADLSLPQYRPDGNLRDFDALVLSTSQARVDEVKEISGKYNILARVVTDNRFRLHKFIYDNIHNLTGVKKIKTFKVI